MLELVIGQRGQKQHGTRRARVEVGRGGGSEEGGKEVVVVDVSSWFNLPDVCRLIAIKMIKDHDPDNMVPERMRDRHSHTEIKHSLEDKAKI